MYKPSVHSSVLTAADGRRHRSRLARLTLIELGAFSVAVASLILPWIDSFAQFLFGGLANTIDASPFLLLTQGHSATFPALSTLPFWPLWVVAASTLLGLGAALVQTIDLLAPQVGGRRVPALVAAVSGGVCIVAAAEFYGAVGNLAHLSVLGVTISSQIGPGCILCVVAALIAAAMALSIVFSAAASAEATAH